MRKLGKTGYQVLKICHIFIAGIWVGSAVVVNVLLTILNGDNIKNNLDLIFIIDFAVVIPCAFLCLLTGILFSAFTNWGFIKHRWIVFKYIVNLIPIISGAIFHGTQLQNMIRLANDLGADALLNYEFKNNYYGFFGVCILYMALFVFVYIISVIKPSFGKKKVKLTNGV